MRNRLNSRRKSPRLSSGELESTTQGLTQINARNLFLQVLAALAPKVFEDLVNEPRRLYVYADLHKFPTRALQEVWDVLTGDKHGSIPSRIARFYESLRAWAKKHHLEVDWFIERGYYTLESSIYSSSEQGWIGNVDDKPSFKPPEPPAGLPPYDATRYPRNEYIKFVIATVFRRLEEDPLLSLAPQKSRVSFVRSVKKEVSKYCDAVEGQIESEGYRSTQERPAIIDHMKWVVRSRVLGESLSSIAESEGLEERSVGKAMRKVFLLVGLPPVGDKRGRPRNSKDKKPRHTTSR